MSNLYWIDPMPDAPEFGFSGKHEKDESIEHAARKVGNVELAEKSELKEKLAMIGLKRIGPTVSLSHLVSNPRFEEHISLISSILLTGTKVFDPTTVVTRAFILADEVHKQAEARAEKANSEETKRKRGY